MNGIVLNPIDVDDDDDLYVLVNRTGYCWDGRKWVRPRNCQLVLRGRQTAFAWQDLLLRGGVLYWVEVARLPLS